MEKLASPSGLQLAVVLVILTFPSSSRAYDDRLQLKDKCKARCESLRPEGWRGQFTFHCEDAYSRGSEKLHCREDCEKECPEHVCSKTERNPFDAYEFLCPSTDIPNNECKDQCDSKRPQDNTNGFELDCYNDFATFDSCENSCKDCPKWVCDPKKSSTTYHCPMKSTDCPECDFVRQTKHKYSYEIGEAFSFSCSNEFDFYEYNERDSCQQNCGSCPESVCDPIFDENSYNCPAVPEPPAVPTHDPSEREYDGKCKKRCDDLRFGGHGAYSFKCQDMFDEPEDQDACYDDCDTCPEHVCTLNNPYSLGKFNCPEDEDYKRRRDSEREREEEDKRNSEEQLRASEGYLIGTVFGVIGFIVCSVIAACCASKNRRQKREAMQQQGNQGSTQQGQYGYGMSFAGQSQVNPGQGLTLQSQPGSSYMSAPSTQMNISVAPNFNSPGVPPNQQLGNENKVVS